MNASLDPVAFQLDMGYGADGTHHQRFNNGVAFSPGQVPGQLRPVAGVRHLHRHDTGADALTLDFGKFYTTAGAEVIEANKNWLYSRSILFNVIPLVHTGARANLKVSDMLSLQAEPGQRLEQRS